MADLADLNQFHEEVDLAVKNIRDLQRMRGVKHGVWSADQDAQFKMLLDSTAHMLLAVQYLANADR